MYSGVPTTSPTRVSPAPAVGTASMRREMPKSITRARPVARSIMMLSGLMSRCTTPRPCAYESAYATSSMSRTASRADSGPVRFTRSARLSPSTNPMANASRSPCSSTACTGTMFGCENDAAVRVSCRNRARSPASPATVGGNTLSATSRSRPSSRARYTAPMPPRPSSRSTRYRSPNRARSVSRSAMDTNERKAPGTTL